MKPATPAAAHRYINGRPLPLIERGEFTIERIPAKLLTRVGWLRVDGDASRYNAVMLRYARYLYEKRRYLAVEYFTR